jgi:NAD(P)-dependent dehydrogenase (short-subunit alcohol dehydrogenase family)
VRVNGIAPGPVEVALWITLLLSPAAAFMTGAVIPLDGGQVIDRE